MKLLVSAADREHSLMAACAMMVVAVTCTRLPHAGE
jgi:hypothetical protein